MRDRSMRNGIGAGNPANLLVNSRRTSQTCLTGPQKYKISRDICTRFGRYLYPTNCSWIINLLIANLGNIGIKLNQSMQFQNTVTQEPILHHNPKEVNRAWEPIFSVHTLSRKLGPT